MWIYAYQYRHSNFYTMVPDEGKLLLQIRQNKKFNYKKKRVAVFGGSTYKLSSWSEDNSNYNI